MATKTGGLIKLTEECGELVQACCKILINPDGISATRLQDLEDEIADVLAAIEYVIEVKQLDKEKIGDRKAIKILNHKKWDRIRESTSTKTGFKKVLGFFAMKLKNLFLYR